MIARFTVVDRADPQDPPAHVAAWTGDVMDLGAVEAVVEDEVAGVRHVRLQSVATGETLARNDIGNRDPAGFLFAATLLED